MPLFKRVDQLPAATGVTGTDFIILSRPSGPTGTVGTRAATLSQLLTFLSTNGGATGPSGATGSSGVITVSAPITNSGTSIAAILGLSVGSGLSIVSGALTAVAESYTLPVASASVLGGVKEGSNVTIDGTGVISVAAPVTWSTIAGKPTFATVATSGAYADLSGTPSAYALPTATSSILGGIKIGSGLTIDGSGVVTAAGTYTLPAASTSVLGGVIVGTGLAVTSGTVSLASTAVTAAAYGSASSVATFTVGADGRLTAAGSTTIAIAAAAVSGLAAVATSGSATDITTGTLDNARLTTRVRSAANLYLWSQFS